MLGTAADIRIQGFTIDQISYFANQIPEFQSGGIGLYYRDNFVHVDVRPGRARWTGN